MTKPLIALPCTAQELENALHAVCDQGLWDAKVRVVCSLNDRLPHRLKLKIETEMKEPQHACVHCANNDCEARGTYQIVVCNNFTTKGEAK